MLGSLAVQPGPGAGALTGVAVDPIGAGASVLARVAEALINVLGAVGACPAGVAQAEIPRDQCLGAQAHAGSFVSVGHLGDPSSWQHG